MQRTLERLLDVAPTKSIEEFLISRAEAERLAKTSHHAVGLETLYLSKLEGETPELAVYIDGVVLAKLADACPFRRLDTENFEAFLLALEGVSHFVMLHFCLQYRRQVRLLDLERQADLDKWGVCYLLLRTQQQSPHPGLAQALFDRLFRGYEVASHLSLIERSRYTGATRRAEQAIGLLLKSFRPNLPLKEVIRAARRNFRQRS